MRKGEALMALVVVLALVGIGVVAAKNKDEILPGGTSPVVPSVTLMPERAPTESVVELDEMQLEEMVRQVQQEGWRVSNVDVAIQSGKITARADSDYPVLKGKVLIEAGRKMENGVGRLDVTRVNLGGREMPSTLQDSVEEVINRGIDEYFEDKGGSWELEEIMENRIRVRVVGPTGIIMTDTVQAYRVRVD